MVLGINKAKEIEAKINKMRQDGRTRLGIIDFENICRASGILEPYHRKEILKYLEAINLVKIDGGILKLNEVK